LRESDTDFKSRSVHIFACPYEVRLFCENRVQTPGAGQSPFSPPRFSASRLTFRKSCFCKLY